MGAAGEVLAGKLGVAAHTVAKCSSLSKSTIGRIWRTFELKPHRVEGFKFSTDLLFVEKVYDVIGLYLNPPEEAVV